ncbi:hypothetical protein DXG01_013157 [Tephrocybe rancida]|nr:hypothetical protein DXG01_013157 [Tephrocybe rancida]
MNDVSLNAIEEDLIHETNTVLPRIMQRLLYTVSYDRKVSLDNWQTALRKQYRKRDPAANPIGPEPRVDEPEQEPSPPPEEPAEPEKEQQNDQATEGTEETKEAFNGEADEDVESKVPDSTRASTLERGFSLGASVKGLSMQPSEIDSIQINQLSATEEQEESKNWLDLPMLTKLDSMHLLTEWQFHNATRLRTLMRSDDDNALWRIEPIGYDSKSNAYWLIGADRLWLQRPIPKPPRTKAAASTTSPLKRKRATAPAKATPKGKGRAAAMPAAKRPRTQEPEATTGRSRAAKSQAKVKLDAQAKELAELNRQANALARSSSGLRMSTRSSPKKPSPKKPPPQKSAGTRVSKRLRGNEEEEEWQAVPEEWLNGGEGSKPYKANGRRGGAKEAKTGLEDGGSEISELTELTEESGKGRAEYDEGDGEDEEEQETAEVPAEEETKAVPEAPLPPIDDRGLGEQPVLPEGFIEWETICVTLYEWEHIAECFEKATHYTEKALYKVLTNTIVPVVTEELREIERKEKLSTAMTQRKRSSRLLLRQSEKEEAEAAERKRREEIEKNGRAMRQEARAKKEEEERERRETAREMRRREREEKERAKSEMSENVTGIGTPGEGADIQVDVVGNGVDHTQQKKQHTKPVRKEAAPTGSGSQNGRNGPKAGGSGTKTPVGEDWELDCEICLRRGINADDGTPMMSCGSCSKWQHIACHDHADQQAGRKRRNWNVVEFFCSQCRARRTGVSRAPPQYMPGPGAMHAQHNPYMNLTTQYAHSNYAPPYGPANGSTSYSREPQTSDTRSGVPSRPIMPHGQPHQQHQAYAAPLTFSHYQPQQRGFSSTTESMYGPSSHTQPYGYSSAQSPYPQYAAMNGTSQHYQQTSQARWNVNTSSQRSTSSQQPIASPYRVGEDRSSGVPPGLLPMPESSRHWQQPLHHSPPPVPPQNGSQFRYHNASYPPGPS